MQIFTKFRIYLRDWANKLCGTPILSIDYSLSPENKYPTALQELVDIYFALTSQSAEIKELLGFNPENIILCGDSAGGSLIIALTLVLNDVRKKIDVKMPKEIVAIYPLTLLRLNPSPSRIFTLFDTFLTVGVVLCVADAYSRIVNCDLDFAQNDSADFNKEKVWYRREIFERRLQEINKMAECAYLSPLLYEDFNSLNDVGLSIVVGEFDPLLDDGVELIKRWKGKKQLDVVENLTHGFLYFKAISKEANEACELALQKIIQVCSAI
ncbi:hormone-sensitive lipase-like protein [Dinothrombium tinctorium]|uniref:Hormone-sensitive lipase-like protein n=1 Tax=Dinothrombium tinctorium TaxID=1965070 RepID=A0A3S3NZ71_9ACAR|nr:hormone-sensitive lipase-like protein [Dinothrombium tinctorium]